MLSTPGQKSMRRRLANFLHKIRQELGYVSCNSIVVQPREGIGVRRKWLALLVGLLVLCPMLVGATAAEQRSYAAGQYALELDGVFAGWLYAAEGGHAVADVVTETLGGDWLQKKHIAAVKYEEITIEVGANMSRELYDWIADTLAGKATRKNGAIIAANYDYKETSRMTFSHALLTEIGMPALDASSKDAARITLKFKPERTRRVKGDGGRLPAPDGKTHKQWLPANFRLRMEGLDEAAQRVSKIEALVIKQRVVEDPVGEHREPQLQPTFIELPNLVITLAEAHAEPLYAWHDDFVVAGNAGDEQEKSGTLEYLTPDMKTVLFSITFRNLGIFKAAPEAGAESIRRVKAEMYCEDLRMTFPQP